MLSTADLASPPMPIAAPMITRPTPIARGRERGFTAVPAVAVPWPFVGWCLGGDRAVASSSMADGQHGGLDEFHRTLDS